MWKMAVFKRKRPGFALIFTVLIALAMVIPVLILASSAITRRRAVNGEAISNRVLTVSDSTVEMVLNDINKFVKTVNDDPVIQDGIDKINEYYKNNYYDLGNIPNPPYEPNKVAVKYTIAYLLSKINGGIPYQPDGISDPAEGVKADYDSYKDAVFTEGDGSLWDIEDNIGSYLYNIKNQAFYVVTSDSSGKIPAYSKDVGYQYVKSFSNSIVKSLSEWDPNYLNDNLWLESDVNVEYIDDGEGNPHSAKFKITVTSYPLSSKENISNIQRTIVAEASLDSLTVESSSSSGSGSSGSSGSNVSVVFQHAVWSGGNTTVNGNITFAAANIQSDGSYTLLPDGGDLYSTDDIILNGLVKVNGNVITGKTSDTNPVIINGAVTIKGGIIYGDEETLPDFPTDTEDNVKNTAISNSKITAGGLTTYANYYLTVNGLSTPYYINGDATLNNTGTINFITTSTNPPVDWYVNGDLTFNGVTDIYASAPGYIWVNGDITFNGIVNVHGPITFVSNGRIIFNGIGKIKYTDDQELVAIISEGSNTSGGIIVNGYGDYDGIFYAPHSDIVFNGQITVFGTVVGAGWSVGSSWQQGVVMNGFSKFIFDTRLAGYNPGGDTPPTPPLPGSSSTPTITGVAFSLKTIYRLMWKEVVNEPVNPQNVKKFCEEGVEFVFNNVSS